jgi:hypothetical protein
MGETPTQRDSSQTTSMELPTPNDTPAPKLVPVRSTLHSRFNNNEVVKPWSHLFRASLLCQNSPSQSQTQSQSSQSTNPFDHSATFAFYQNRLLASTEDLSKLIENVSSTISHDKTTLEALIGNTKELVETVRQENVARHDQNMKDSSLLT